MGRSVIILLFIIGLYNVGLSNNIVRIDTLLARKHYDLGNHFKKQGRYDSSVLYFQKAAEGYKSFNNLNKRYLESLRAQAQGLVELGKTTQALELISIVIKTVSKEDTKLMASALNIAGNAYRANGQNSKAIDQYERALSILQIDKKTKEEDKAATYNNLGTTYTGMGEYNLALEYYQKVLALDIKSEEPNEVNLSKSHSNLGYLYIYTGDFDAALEHSLKALYLRKKTLPAGHPEIANSYYNIGICYDAKGLYELSLEFHEKALSNLMTNFGDKHPRIAMSYHNIGMAYDQMGFFERSLDYHLKGLAIWISSFGDEHPDLAYGYTYIGTAYCKKKDWGLALEYFSKALVIRRKSLGEGHPFVAMLYNNIGDVYLEQGYFDRALEYFHKALVIRQSNFGEDHQDVSYSYSSMGKAHIKKGNYAQAQKCFNKALDIRHHEFGKRHPLVAQSYNDLGDLHFLISQFSAASEFYQEALSANKSGYNNKALSAPIMVSSFLGKSQTLEKIFELTGNTHKLSESLGLLQRCDSLLDQTSKTYLNYEDKLHLSRISASIYENGVRISFSLHQLMNDNNYDHLAFYFAEKSRSRLLLESINSISAKRIGLLPDSLIDLEQRIKADKASLISKLEAYEPTQHTNNLDTIALLEDKLFKTERSQDSLNLLIGNKYPHYHTLKYLNNTIGVDEIRHELPSNSAIIQYFFTWEALYVFTITKEQFTINRIKQIESIIQNIDKLSLSFRVAHSLEQSDTSFWEFVSTSSNLYQGIIKESLPKNKHIKSLVFIPDKKLAYIPFEILVKSSSFETVGNYSALEYLIKDYSISYAYSATLAFPKKHGRISTPAKAKFVGYAPSYANIDQPQQRSGLTSLFWNQQEVKEISKLIGGEYKLAADASETRFKKDFENYSVIHLAMHALIDDSEPMFSKLVFSQNNGDSINDGYLHTYELFGMETNSELVVLSACNTGYGKLETGEGLMSLAYSFAYAGCPSIMMSLWPVDDESTSELMKYFYQNISQGMHKDEALRNAKLEFLKDPSRSSSNPLFWGGFVLAGDIQPMDNTSSKIYFWAIVLAIALTLFVIVRRKLNLQFRSDKT